MTSRSFISALVVFAAAALFAANAAAQASVSKPKPKLGPAKVTISKETTYLTGPLRSDGWIDFATAINEHCSKGVTRENNAAVLFWQAAGPKQIAVTARGEFFRQLGIDVPPDVGDYLSDLFEYLPRRNEHPNAPADEYVWEAGIVKQLDVAKSRPWTAAEFPVLAGWLNVNRAPLELISACAKRPRYFQPVIVEAGNPMWNSDLITELNASRSAVDILRIRAMQRLAQGKTDDGWNDLMTCHRLAHLLAQRPNFVKALIAIMLEQSASDGDVEFLRHATQTPAQLMRHRRDLAELSAMPPLRSTVFGERLSSLDFLRWLAGGDAEARNLSSGFVLVDEFKETREKLLADKRVDWDVVFRACNIEFDEMEKILQLPGELRQREELNRRERLESDAAKRVNDPAVLANLLGPRGTSAEVSQRLADVLLGSSGIGSFSGLASARIAVTAKSQLTDFAIALAWYHMDHKSYPKMLSELAPRYISAIPNDPYSDRAYIYQPQDGGYLLYSVGRNGRDDHGANAIADHLKQFEGETDPDKLPDDICIHSPKE
jgi:hypothetical protein